jgi:ferritin-like metal-binding protein YciE
MTEPKETLLEWLRDAYAMERGLELTLKKQSENDEIPERLRSQCRIHLDETRRHAEAVWACLEGLGTDTSAMKTGMARVMETIKGVGTAFASDEKVKDILASYASEHFEIACYTALRAAGLELGIEQVVSLCDNIIPDEQRMADWLAANLPEVVALHLAEAPAAV